MTHSPTPRIAPAQTPFAASIQATLDRVMPPGQPPLALFTTLARDERLFGKFFASNLLDRGHLSLRQRELVILRTTALCGSGYEWGVHVALFAQRTGLGPAPLAALAHGQPDDEVWSPAEQALLRLCDQLHRHCNIDDTLWTALRQHFSEEAVLELLLLAGFYRTVSSLTNSLQLPLEPGTTGLPPQA